MLKSRWQNACIAGEREEKLANSAKRLRRTVSPFFETTSERNAREVLPSGLQSRALLQLGELLHLLLYATPRENYS